MLLVLNARYCIRELFNKRKHLWILQFFRQLQMFSHKISIVVNNLQSFNVQWTATINVLRQMVECFLILSAYSSNSTKSL